VSIRVSDVSGKVRAYGRNCEFKFVDVIDGQPSQFTLHGLTKQRVATLLRYLDAVGGETAGAALGGDHGTMMTALADRDDDEPQESGETAGEAQSVTLSFDSAAVLAAIDTLEQRVMGFVHEAEHTSASTAVKLEAMTAQQDTLARDVFNLAGSVTELSSALTKLDAPAPAAPRKKRAVADAPATVEQGLAPAKSMEQIAGEVAETMFRGSPDLANAEAALPSQPVPPSDDDGSTDIGTDRTLTVEVAPVQGAEPVVDAPTAEVVRPVVLDAEPLPVDSRPPASPGDDAKPIPEATPVPRAAESSAPVQAQADDPFANPFFEGEPPLDRLRARCRAAVSLKEIVRALYQHGDAKTKDQILALCDTFKPELIIIQRAVSLADRVERYVDEFSREG
jgi:hypothetical protein